MHIIYLKCNIKYIYIIYIITINDTIYIIQAIYTHLNEFDCSCILPHLVTTYLWKTVSRGATYHFKVVKLL